MEDTATRTDIDELRVMMYGLLARIYGKEVDQALYDALKEFSQTAAVQADDGLAPEGFKALQAYFVQPSINPLTDLAVDYARVFLGAGIADSSAAYPYESVYTSKDGLMMQESRDEVLALYKQWGLGRLQELVEPEDHLAFEFEFMMYLVQEQLNARAAGDDERVRKTIDQQAAFLRDHIAKWVFLLCDDVDRYSTTAFYPAVAEVTRAFVRSEAELLGVEVQEQVIADA